MKELLSILIAAAALISQANAKKSCVRVVNQILVSKLCPDPNARCLVRDNPDFYKKNDPAFYNRITKCMIATSATARRSYGRQECNGVLRLDRDGSLFFRIPPGRAL